MTQLAITCSTTPQRVITRSEGYVTDWIIQNLGAGDIYVLESSGSYLQGQKIPSGASMSKDDWKGEIWIVTDTNTNDTRVMYGTWRIGEKCGK